MSTAIASSAPTVGLGYIMHHSGQEGHGLRWQLAYVEALIANDGFPVPLPLYRQGRPVAGVKLASRWQRIAVDKWFEDRLPPEAAEAEDARERLAANDDMDAAAAAVAATVRGRRLGFGEGARA